MSAWLFSLFINDLIYKLIETNCGLILGNLHIPTILLADDTTLLSTTANGVQNLLNTVDRYARNWRLRYNAGKSNCLVFTPSKTIKSDSEYIFRFGEKTITTSDNVTYAGTLIDVSRKTINRTENACKKLKKNLHSLYKIGVNRDDLPSVTNNIIWKRIILPTALYACETWGRLTATEIDLLEQTQRYFVRFVLGFDKRSPKDSCISVLGLWSIQGLIDKFKLLLFGRLCRAKHNTAHKQLFTFRLCQILNGFCDENAITYDLVKTLLKYDLSSFLECYIEDT